MAKQESVVTNRPDLILKHNLLMPILATEARVDEIRKQIQDINSSEVINGLFVILVSYLEAMHKEILKYYLRYNPINIRIWEKTIQIDKRLMVDGDGFRLIGHIVDEYLDYMPYGTLIPVFYNALNINNASNSLHIVDIQRKRNNLIHSSIIIDIKNNQASNNNISKEYIESCIYEYVQYLNHMKDVIASKYIEQTRINVLKGLWRYTFRTGLCADFDAYWHIYTEKNIIVGLKHPDYENRLSTSEIFMLSIWRSQLTDYNVKFLNMSSLGDHMQSCLYMFLKLSNDIFLYQ
ncbi:MAG: hypothetical protein ACP5IL_10510 [Syntrophobacteraceae bacterium]